MQKIKGQRPAGSHWASVKPCCVVCGVYSQSLAFFSICLSLDFRGFVVVVHLFISKTESHLDEADSKPRITLNKSSSDLGFQVLGLQVFTTMASIEPHSSSTCDDVACDGVVWCGRVW